MQKRTRGMDQVIEQTKTLSENPSIPFSPKKNKKKRKEN
jgi:hypothetical protein